MAPRQISRIRPQLPGKWFRGRSAEERGPSRNWCPFLSARAKAAGQKGKNGEVLLRAATYSSFDALPPSLPLPPSPSPAAFLYSVPSLVPDSPDSPIDQHANVRERATTDEIYIYLEILGLIILRCPKTTKSDDYRLKIPFPSFSNRKCLLY